MDPWKNGLMGKQMDKHSYRLAIFNYKKRERKGKKKENKRI